MDNHIFIGLESIIPPITNTSLSWQKNQFCGYEIKGQIRELENKSWPVNYKVCSLLSGTHNCVKMI